LLILVISKTNCQTHPSMCIRMGYSSPITKHDYIWHCAFFFFVIAFSHAHNHTQKSKFVWFMWKDQTYFLKTGHSILGLHSNTCSKGCDHSLALICTRGVFGYQVMTSGGHVYHNDKEKQDSIKRKTQRWSSVAISKVFLKSFSKLKQR